MPMKFPANIVVMISESITPKFSVQNKKREKVRQWKEDSYLINREAKEKDPCHP
jgi:hypothetical protein